MEGGKKCYGVYLGLQDKQGHRYWFFEDLSKNGEVILTKEISIFSKKLGETSIGHIYEFTRLDNSVSFSKKPQSLGQWKNTSDIREWKSLSLAYADSKRALKTPEDATLKKAVEPLRELYRNADRGTRTFLLGEIIRLITSW